MDWDEFESKWKGPGGFIDEIEIDKAGRYGQYITDKAKLQQSIQLEKEKEIENYGGMTKKDFNDMYIENMYPDGGEEDDQRDD